MATFNNNVTNIDMFPNSLIDSNESLKWKTMEGQGVRARSLARNTLEVEGYAKSSGWD
jgi:hypothetical protein